MNPQPTPGPVGQYHPKGIEQLRAENERLREALVSVMKHLPSLWGDEVRDGTITLVVEADAIDDADALLREGGGDE